jgi:Sec-independent protein secretion pathway component TatC
MKLTVVIFLAPLTMTLLCILGGVEHPALFCAWLLSAVVCLVRGCVLIPRKRWLGLLCIAAGSIPIFLALSPVLHIRFRDDRIHHEMGEGV